jgi:hypothetical protein
MLQPYSAAPLTSISLVNKPLMLVSQVVCREDDILRDICFLHTGWGLIFCLKLFLPSGLKSARGLGRMKLEFRHNRRELPWVNHSGDMLYNRRITTSVVSQVFKKPEWVLLWRAPVAQRQQGHTFLEKKKDYKERAAATNERKKFIQQVQSQVRRKSREW